ncbi:MAG: hypothetical protein FWE02_05595 [Defluviitaleaceae bacterium]|nr:hypothetical protein [Defluviitaleaceae bacterium]
MKKLILGTLTALMITGGVITAFASTPAASSYQNTQSQFNTVNHGISRIS